MKRDEEGAGHRHARLQGIVFEELSSLLDCEVTDPELEGVVIVAVVLSVDYRHARVHFTLGPRAAPTPTSLRSVNSPCAAPGPSIGPRARQSRRAMERAAPFLRRRLAQAADLKRVPELRFVLEPVSALGGES